jgi:hypothetical protein
VATIDISYKIGTADRAPKACVEDAVRQMLDDFHPDSWHLETVTVGWEFVHCSFHMTFNRREPWLNGTDPGT